MEQVNEFYTWSEVLDMSFAACLKLEKLSGMDSRFNAKHANAVSHHDEILAAIRNGESCYYLRQS
jgi:hypothetical protein